MSLAKKSGIQLPDRMRNKLESFQKRVWMIKLAEGLLAAAFGLLVSYLLVFALDRFIDTPAIVRAVILIVGALGLGVWFPLVCHKWVWKSRRLEQVARLLKYKFPRLGDHLLGIIELVNNEEEHQHSEALTRAALAQVDEETKDRDFSNAVPKPKHKRWALIAGIPAAIAIAALVIVPAAGGNALMRWLMPWKHTERFTFTQLEQLPDSMVVPVSEPSSLTAILTDGSQWSPEQGTLNVAGTTVNADKVDQEYGFTVPPLNGDSKMRVAIGDARKTIDVQPKARPELTSLLAQIQLPKYLQRKLYIPHAFVVIPKPVSKDIRGGVVTMLKDSQVSFVGTATREIANATADGQLLRVDGAEMFTSAVDVPDSRMMEFNWKDALGLSAKSPLTLKIRAEDDAQPSLVCRKLEQQRVIMVKDVLTFEVDAQDDYGVKTIGMEWSGRVAPEANYDEAVGEKVISAGNADATELDGVATFSPSRLGIQPQLIQLRMFAVDFNPECERVYSPTYTIFVLSEEEHAIWLSKQMDEWYKQSLETYERERQLFKRNVELRNLPAEELDKAEVRDKIEAQAAAENAQSRRLSALTKSGTDLVKEAARNDQFNVATVEKMAEMLQALDGIANERMPSVADLLKEAAESASSTDPSAAKEGKSSGDSKSESAPSVNDAKGSSEGEGSSESKSKTPSVNMSESSMSKKEEGEGDESEQQPSGGGGSKFSLPGVQLQDNSPDQPSDEPQSCPAGDAMDDAVKAQEELLAEFQRVAEELKKIIQNLEGSTFVKRLKAMSRRHIELAQDVNEMTLGQFGELENKVRESTKERAKMLSNREVLHSNTLADIQDDLEAYVNRVNEGKFTTVLNEMKNEEVIKQVTEVAEKIEMNETGGSIAHSEFLADNFDRWAEQLVGPG